METLALAAAAVVMGAAPGFPVAADDEDWMAMNVDGEGGGGRSSESRRWRSFPGGGEAVDPAAVEDSKFSAEPNRFIPVVWPPVLRSPLPGPRSSVAFPDG